MDRFDSMTVLVAVVAAGSLSAASRQLRMPLPTVSRKLSELESHLGVKLLMRSTRKLALTDAGESYVAACKRILEDVAAAERGATGEYRAPRGELVMTAPVVFGRLHVLPVSADFLKAYPEVDLRLILNDRPLNLIDEHVDVALRVGVIPDSRLVAIRVGQIRSVVCASPEYLKHRGSPKTPADLQTHDCVTFSALGSSESWGFHAGESVRVRSRLSVNAAECAIDAAIAGVGITRVLSYQAASAAQAGTLKILLRNFETDPLPVGLIYTQDSRLPLKLRAFLDFATPRLRERLSRAMQV